MDESQEFKLSRRAMLALLGASATAAFIGGCETTGHNGVITDLPDGQFVPRDRSLVPGGDPERYAPPGPPKYTGPINPLPPPRNTFGIIPRSYWAKAGPNLKTIDPMDGVRLVTFHHSGDPKPFSTDNFNETAQHLEWVREYHRDRKFQDIGYHFAIDRAGRVWQLRSLRYQGQHVRYHNEHNIGVVVLGNFDMQRPTQAQLDRIKAFGALLRKQYSLGINRIYTHREIVSTDCPGDAMQPYMVQVRRQGLV